MATKHASESDRKVAARRRPGRRRSLWSWFAGSLFVLFVAIIALPSIICATPLVDHLLARSGAAYGWHVRAMQVRWGWLKPLHVYKLECTGPSGQTQLKVDSVATEIRIWDMLGGRSDLGTVTVQGTSLQLAVGSGTTSLEADLAAITTPDNEPGNESSGDAPRRLQVNWSQVEVVVIDPNGGTWSAREGQGTADVQSLLGQWQITSNVTLRCIDVGQQSGQLEGQFALTPPTDTTPAQWSARLRASSIPFSYAQLAAWRFPDIASQLPQGFQGILDGEITCMGDPNAASVQMYASPLQVSQVSMHDVRFGDRPWQIANLSVEGNVQWWPGHVRGDPLRLTTDFGTTELRGILAVERLAGTLQEQMTALAGDLELQVDVARLDQSLPGIVPLRQDARLTGGSLRMRARAENDEQGNPRLQVGAETEQISGNAFNKQVSIPPVSLNLTLRPTPGWPIADKLELHSLFANASASGEMQNGSAQFDVNLGRLAEFIKPLLELPELQLDGEAAGQVKWALEPGEKWRLTGRGNASRLVIQLPGGASLSEPALDATVDAAGIWDQDHLAELSESKVLLNDGAQQWVVQLVQPVANPSATSSLALQAEGSGQLAALRQLIGPWLPNAFGDAEGSFQTSARAVIAADHVEISQVATELRQAGVLYDNRWYRPETMTFDFQGLAVLPAGNVDIQRCSLQTPAASVDIAGVWNESSPPQLNAQYQVDFRKLGDLLGVQAGSIPSLAVRPAIANGAITPAPPSTWIHGDLSGRASLTQRDQNFVFQVAADLNQLTLLSLPMLDVTPGQILPPSAPPPQILWNERAVRFEGELLANSDWSRFSTDSLQLSTEWFQAAVKGAYLRSESLSEAEVKGQIRVDTALMAQRAEPLIGQHFTLTGTHTSPLQATYRQTPERTQWNAKTELGWEQGEFASLVLGPAKIGVEADEHQIVVLPTSIPLKSGKLQAGGQATYDPSPLTISVSPGLVAESVALDADLCRGWLKYVAPIVADATSVNGVFSLELDQANWVPSRPEDSVVQGHLKIANAEVGPGPLSGQLAALIETIKAATRGQAAPSQEPSLAGQWIRMPEQTVDFAMSQGKVEHRQLVFESGNVQIATSGVVTLDGRLSLIAKIPLDAKWLGDDTVSRAMIGQTLQLPIDGTLSQPSLDSRSTREMLTQFGAQTLERAAGNLLNRTLERGFDRLLRQK